MVCFGSGSVASRGPPSWTRSHCYVPLDRSAQLAPRYFKYASLSSWSSAAASGRRSPPRQQKVAISPMYKSPSLTFRGILLRRYVVELCKQKYPQFKTELDAFLNMSWYKLKFGVSIDGTQDSRYPHASIRGPGVSFCWCRGISARRSWIIKIVCL